MTTLPEPGAEPPRDWTPRDVDLSTPSTARMYDYYLGGKDNYPVDRDAAEQVLQASPQARTTMRANRGFLVEAVRRCTAAGIDQFLDLGTGIPTSPSVHEVARETHPDARVVYVDNDPVVLAHNRALLVKDERVTTIDGDIRAPEAIVNHPETRRLIDFDQPVAVLAVSVLHFVAHENPEGVVATFTEKMSPGSHLVISVITPEGLSEDEQRRLRETYRNSTASSADQIPADRLAGLFSGFTLLDHGLAPVWQWCGDPNLATQLTSRGGIGIKP